MLKLCIFFYFRILLLINRTRTNSVICVQNFLRKWRGDKFCRFCYGIDNLPALFFHSSVSRVLRNMVQRFLLLHNVINKKRYISNVKCLIKSYYWEVSWKFIKVDWKLRFSKFKKFASGSVFGEPQLRQIHWILKLLAST